MLRFVFWASKERFPEVGFAHARVHAFVVERQSTGVWLAGEDLPVRVGDDGREIGHQVASAKASVFTAALNVWYAGFGEKFSFTIPNPPFPCPGPSQ